MALFRYGLIADVLRLLLGSREIRRALHEKAQRTYVIPGTRRTRVAVETGQKADVALRRPYTDQQSGDLPCHRARRREATRCWHPFGDPEARRWFNYYGSIMCGWGFRKATG